MGVGDRSGAHATTEAGARGAVLTRAGAAAIALATLGLAPPTAGTAPGGLGEAAASMGDPGAPAAAPPPLAFDRPAALAELRRLATTGSQCGRGGAGPTEAIVFVTFGPGGEVARVRVDAAVPRSIAACLRAVYRDARVPPFRGAAWPFRQRVPLR
jgi:hypothetical protein